jgi:hypothetical protein
VNMPVLQSLDDIPADAKVYPSFWQGKLKTVLIPEMVNPESSLGLLKGTYDCDVLVVSCCGFRATYLDSSFFANVFRVIHPEIIQKVKERQNIYDLSKKWGVHLRGTDRAGMLNKSHRISSLGVKLINNGLYSGSSVIGVSDDQEYIKLWKARFPSFPILTQVGNIGGTGGVHNIPKDSLPVSKNSLNIDMLVDFFTLASCSNIFTTCNDSRFAKEAVCMRPHIATILN